MEPIQYRGYTIKSGEYTKFTFIHEDYDGPEDKRIGDRDDLQQCMLDIDDQVIERQAKEIERLEKVIKRLDYMIDNMPTP